MGYASRINVRGVQAGSHFDPSEVGMSPEELHSLIGEGKVVELDANDRAVDQATSIARHAPAHAAGGVAGAGGVSTTNTNTSGPAQPGASSSSSQVSTTSVGGTATPGASSSSSNVDSSSSSSQ